MISVFNTVVEEVYPALNASIAKILIKKGVKQTTIAHHLGITQAMVSKYSSAQHAVDKNLGKEIAPFSERISELILSNTPREKIAEIVSRQTIQWVESGILCNLTKKKYNIEDCSSCYNLLLPSARNEKQDIIQNLERAVVLLEKNDIHEFIPEVRINIAMASSTATAKEQVASIPGRLITINNKLKAIMKPKFGSSHFLSELLLRIKRYNSDANAIINIKYNESIKKMLQKQKFGCVEDLNQLSSSNLKDIDCIIEKGSFGIEPNAYFIGRDAIEVVNKVLRLYKSPRGTQISDKT